MFNPKRYKMISELTRTGSKWSVRRCDIVFTNRLMRSLRITFPTYAINCEDTAITGLSGLPCAR